MYVLKCPLIFLTSKKPRVLPDRWVPYLITAWFARSCTDSIGAFILSNVRKAARLAVYDDMIMSVKNHHTHVTSLVEIVTGTTSVPVKP